MSDEIFEQGEKIKRELLLLSRTLRKPTLSAAVDYMDKLELLLVEAEGCIANLENLGLVKPIAEILHDFTRPKPKLTQSRVLPIIKNPKIEKSDLPEEIQHLGPKVLDAFIVLVGESLEWGGEPCVGSSSAGSSLRGALPHLKRAGLLTTFVKTDGSQRGNGTYVKFTEFGQRMADRIDDLINPDSGAW
jgi:hypothetical protein